MPRLAASGGAPEIRLVPIDDEAKLGNCENLKRKSKKYVGNAMWIIGLAYIFRKNMNAYGVYDGNRLVGLLLLNESTCYKIGEMMIGDKFQRRGYGAAAVRAVIEHCRAQGDFPEISLAVHKSNQIAIHMYERCGFITAENAPWDENFLVMKYRL